MTQSIFDLVKTSAELDLKGPTGEDLGVKVRVQGLSTPTVKQKAVEANAQLMHAGKASDPASFAKLLTQAEKTATEMAGLAVVGWDNDEMMGGPYTPEYAKSLMAKPELEFIRRQVNEFVSEQSNFFSKPVLG
jgi:hypothetical protein